MRKRGISLLFIVIFVLSLVSCGVSSSDMDDYVTNKDYSNKSQTENVQLTETKAGTKVIKKENLKTFVFYFFIQRINVTPNHARINADIGNFPSGIIRFNFPIRRIRFDKF